MTNLHEIHHVANFSVAYLLRKSHVELVRDAETFGNPIPSLRMQVMKINQDSCRFRDETIIREYEWDESWNHCGNCKICKPETAEGEPAAQPATVKG